MRGQVKIHQHKIVARRRRRIFLITLYSFCALVLITMALSFTSHIPKLLIKEVIVEGNSKVSASAIESVALDAVAGNYLHLFLKSNSLIYPRDVVEERIAAIPAIESVDVSRASLTSLRIGVTERKEAAVWCRRDAEADQCYFMDRDGLVFSPAAATSTIVYRGNLEGDPIGKRFMDASDFKKMQFFMQELSGLSVSPREVVLGDTGYMTVILAKGGRLIINSSDDLSVVLGNIAAVISDKSVAPDFARFLDELDYIKLDTGNKVVYKLKQ
jgi:hypothetical protein